MLSLLSGNTLTQGTTLLTGNSPLLWNWQAFQDSFTTLLDDPHKQQNAEEAPSRLLGKLLLTSSAFDTW